MARNRRARESSTAAASLGSRGKNKEFKPGNTLRRALKEQSAQLYKLFGIWDEDASGAIDEKEFRRAVRMLGLRCNDDDFKTFCSMCDKDNSGDIDLDELINLLEEPCSDDDDDDDDGGGGAGKARRWRNPVACCCRGALWLLNTTGVQTFLYLAFVFVFQQIVQVHHLQHRLASNRIGEAL